MVCSIRKSDLENKVLSLCETQLAPHGLRPVDADVRIGPKSLVRIFVERVSDKNEPTSMDDCRRANELISPAIEAEDLTEGSYDLEVSSPGLDCRLRLISDFNRIVNEEVKLELHESMPQVGANVRGILKEVNEDGTIKVFTSGKDVVIPLGNIRKANRIWNFEGRK